MKTRLEIKGIEKLTHSTYWPEILKLCVVKESSDLYEFLLKYGPLDIVVIMPKLAERVLLPKQYWSGFQITFSIHVGNPLYTNVAESCITSLANPHDFAQTLKNHIYANKPKLGLT
jgi:hypothetical protein